jgi:hypothetical protein
MVPGLLRFYFADQTSKMSDGEFYNPKRRWKDFRPRQASRGFKTTGVPTNLATISLFNNSTGAELLVVRDMTISGTASDQVAVSNVGGQVGSSQGLVHSVVVGGAATPGLVASIDTATVYPADYSIALSTLAVFEWMHDFPFGVLLPGASLVFQVTTAAHALSVSLLWEAVSEDQLDWAW